MIELLNDAAALERVKASNITALTECATLTTFYVDGLAFEQLEANRRITHIAADTAFTACSNEHQLFTAAFISSIFAGYMIATLHGPGDRELDWMMVDPLFHGHGVADCLMQTGIDWLGPDRSMWLNVIRHNERAIRFYRRYGFEVDYEARTDHIVPHFIMRRTAVA